MILSLFVMSLVGVVMGFSGLRIARGGTWRQTAGLVVVALAMLGLHLTHLLDGLRLARWLPMADCMFYTNLALPLGGLLVGLAWPTLRIPPGRKLLLLGALLCLGLWPSYGRLLRPRPQVGPPLWHSGLCQQTTASTCAPAACATILAAAGIPASEAELAQLCYTTSTGTSGLGAFRALKIKTRSTPWEVVVFYGAADEVQSQGFVGGVISVPFAGGKSSLPGGGERHELAITEVAADGSVTAADPLAGNASVWPAATFAQRWPGQGIFLRRKPR